MSLKLDGKKLSLEIEERLTDYISCNKKIAKRAPGLAVIRIGDDPRVVFTLIIRKKHVQGLE